MSMPHTKKVRAHVINKLQERGVELIDIAQVVLILQSPYNPELTIETCLHNVELVLDKREVLNAALVGIELDELAEKKLLSQPLQEMIETDEGLFGIDETIAIGIANIYGSIGFTSYGYVDKNKIGIIAELDSHGAKVNTFLDDIVGAIAAAAASRVAHRSRDKQEEELEEE